MEHADPPPIESFARRVEHSIGRDLVGVLHVDLDGGEQLIVLTSQTGSGAAGEVVQLLPHPEELAQERIQVQGFEDFCALVGNGDPTALNAATHGTVLTDPVAVLDELRHRCQSALNDPSAININSLHSYLLHRARESRTKAARYVAEAVAQLQSALLATAQAHHAATDPSNDGATTSLERILQLLSIDDLRTEIDDLVGIEDRGALADLVSDPESLAADFHSVLAAVERYEHQVFGSCDDHKYE